MTLLKVLTTTSKFKLTMELALVGGDCGDDLGSHMVLAADTIVRTFLYVIELSVIALYKMELSSLLEPQEL